MFSPAAANVPFSDTVTGALFSGVLGAVIGGLATAAAVWWTLRAERRAREATRTQELVADAVAHGNLLFMALADHEEAIQRSRDLGDTYRGSMAAWVGMKSAAVRLQLHIGRETLGAQTIELLMSDVFSGWHRVGSEAESTDPAAEAVSILLGMLMALESAQVSGGFDNRAKRRFGRDVTPERVADMYRKIDSAQSARNG